MLYHSGGKTRNQTNRGLLRAVIVTHKGCPFPSNTNRPICIRTSPPRGGEEEERLQAARRLLINGKYHLKKCWAACLIDGLILCAQLFYSS